MKSYPTKKRQLLIIVILIGLVFLGALSFPGQIAARQATPQPTPTSTILPDDQALISGDTNGLMLGAGAIMFIILSGVIIQRIINKPDPDSIQDQF